MAQELDSRICEKVFPRQGLANIGNTWQWGRVHLKEKDEFPLLGA